MRKLMFAGVIAAAVVAAPAYAANAPTIVFQENTYTPIAGQGPVTFFENFETLPVGSPAVTAQPGGTGSGSNAVIQRGDLPGRAISPTNDLNNKYLAVGGNTSGAGGTYTINFTSAQQYLAFSFGTLDSYNSLTLTFADTTTQVFNGSAIVGRTDTCTGNGGLCTYNTGSAANGEITGRVNYYANGSGITAVTFTSNTFGSFEVDDVAAAVPEPATWAMMIAGFGLAGASLRSRRRQGKIAIA